MLTLTTEPSLQLPNTCSNVSHTPCSARFPADVKHAASNGGWSVNDTERMWKNSIVANFKARLLSHHLGASNSNRQWGKKECKYFMWDLRFSKQCWWKSWSSEMWFCVVGYFRTFRKPAVSLSSVSNCPWRAVVREDRACVVLTPQHSFASQNTRTFGKYFN